MLEDSAVRTDILQGTAISPSPHHFAHFYQGPWPKLSQPLVVLAAFSTYQDLQSRHDSSGWAQLMALCMENSHTGIIAPV